MKRSISAWTMACCAAIAAFACEGERGTIGISLVFAPDSTLPEAISVARLSLSNPARTIEAQRDADGRFYLALEVVAGGESAAVSFEGLDRDGAVIAYGRSAPLPIAAIDFELTIYVAAPMSLDAAPVLLDPPRSELASALLNYGVLLAGGRTASTDPSDQVAIYSVYDHEFQVGLPLPIPRSSVSAMTGSQGRVFLFGGLDEDETPTSNLWRFDTNFAPAGAYVELESRVEFARVGAAAAPIDVDQFLLTGDPPVLVNGPGGRAEEMDFSSALFGRAATVVLDGTPYTLITGARAGKTGAVRFSRFAFVELQGVPELLREGHSTVALPSVSADILTVAGTIDGVPTASAVRFNTVRQDFTVYPDLLDTPRSGAGVAVTSRYLVVVGGKDSSGTLVGNAEVFDADDLSQVAILPMRVARSEATVAPLINGQVLIAGGLGEDGLPVDVVELFTPDSLLRD